ncbi:OmpA family protein [Campylobacter sp. RM12920]|uniref:OmpA family protein n=1 Tax=Campylobacter californiensis TaxID=1032243 RepID=A0ABD4JJQ2_9BACT|nr:OmpA family protein [Campylobacter sp. RM12919]MBE2987633.1 OmpA family protein [Campylobacter sp. RM12920]
MKIDKKDQASSTFWVSYADLMAGLLFVFMLLIGAIVVKYVLSQNTLASKEQAIIAALANLKDEQGKNITLDRLNAALKSELAKIGDENLELKKANEIYIVELDALKERLERAVNENLDANASIKDLNASILNLNQQMIILTDELKAAEENATTQSEDNEKNLAKIAFLLEQVSQKEARYDEILRDLNITKSRIKNLTGIRVKVIGALKERLGSDIAIDPNSGALKLSSSVLFDKGRAEIKDEVKNELKLTLQKYFDVLLNDEEISKNIDQIMIEGFTDSDGSYLYNLELSQRRAYAVMDFINSYSSDENLRKHLVASGRSFNELVMKDGVEDKDASRRIEIKFLISNKEAIKEIEKFLEHTP